MKTKSFFIGWLGGALLSLPFMCISYLPYIKLVSLLTLVYKYSGLKQSVTRTIFMFISCFVGVRFFAMVGIIRVVNDFFDIVENESNDRAAGVGMVYFLAIVLFACAIISIVLFIISHIKKKSE